jgi:TonB family protein
MFETLLESGPQRRSSGRAGAVAFAVHIGMVALAVNETKGHFLQPPVIRPIEIPAYDPIETQADPSPSVPSTTAEPDLPAPWSSPITEPGPISIEPIRIDPGVAADPVADLRRSIRNDSQARSFSFGTARRGSGPWEDVLLPGEVDDPVRVLEAASPRYPRSLEMAGIAGRVVLQFVVDTLGQVERATITVSEATDSAFARSSREAITATRFSPAHMRGQVVRQLVRQTHLFRTSQ